MKKISILTAAVLLGGLTQLSAQWVTFPVVFHVLYVSNTQNLHDTILQHQVDVLNEDFNAANPDIVNVPPVWQPIIGNMNISFVFASIDPNGNPTNGIERRQVATFNGLNAHSTAAGGLDPWPDTSYLNIWVWQLPNGLLGMAPFPGVTTGDDGMDLTWYVVGRGTYAMEPYNRGRVATHELAHWFGLRHIWGDSPGCITDDGIADTPVQDQETYGFHAPGTILTDMCQQTAPGKMWMNYLDFTDDTSMCMFTQGQCLEMTNVINSMRMGFLTPDGIDGVNEHQSLSKYNVFPSPS
ncbi:MAG TPA: M43 family zinc metalloprotease, partial [Bacteroidia bacterium]|nr:M43 family zinc metalloprotease [Bacteroidia bacterium]